jgi:hypothetical protein
MRDDEGNPWKYQDRLEALRMSPLNPVECGISPVTPVFFHITMHSKAEIRGVGARRRPTLLHFLLVY